MDALHLKAVTTEFSVRESLCASFASHFHRLQILFTQEVITLSKTLDPSGFETLMDLCGSISECKSSPKVWLERWVGSGLASPEASAAVSKIDLA